MYKIIGINKSTNCGAYGERKVFSNYLGLSLIPTYLNGELTHGWIIPERNIMPDFVIGSDGLGFTRKNSRHYVSRKDQEIYLKNEGFTDVFTIGHPIIYIDRKKLPKRIKNSLLVMPPHSLIDTQEDWVESAMNYEKFLRDYIKDFNLVALCLNQNDIIKGNWENLKNIIPHFFSGSLETDCNSYYRMSELFSMFEYVTTNEFGSHVAYASYFGAKVSVCGPRPKFRKLDYINLTFYKNQPEILEILENWKSQNKMAEWYPQFNCLPTQATQNLDWAKKQLGEDYKMSQSDLKILFEWSFSNVFYKYVFYKMGKIHAIKPVLNFIIYFGLINGLLNYIKIINAKKIKNGICRLINNNKSYINIRNGSSDIDVCLQHFGNRELLNIEYPKITEIIFDFGSNIGISVEIFTKLFPNAKIIAVEMDSENFMLLNQNHQNNSNVKTINAALWSHTGEVKQIDIGEDSWCFRAGNHYGKEVGIVKAISFKDLCVMNNIHQIDVIKMDIEGSEKEVMESCWKEILPITKLLIIEIHSWIPGCTESITKILKEAVSLFRLDISHSGEFTLIRNLDL